MGCQPEITRVEEVWIFILTEYLKDYYSTAKAVCQFRSAKVERMLFGADCASGFTGPLNENLSLIFCSV